MKQYIVVGVLVLLQLSVHSQTSLVPSFIEPYPLEISVNKTTNLVFSYAIKSVDRGSPNILAQKAGNVDTVLQVKAARQDFAETNLTVITTDGRLYSFLVHYSPTPLHLNYHFHPVNNPGDNVFSRRGSERTLDNEADFLQHANSIIEHKKFIHGFKSSKYKIQLQLQGIYVRNGNIFFHLQIKNNSNLPYQVELIRFLIKDKKQDKRTSQQEVEISPVYKYGNTRSIAANDISHCVFVFPAFTIANSKNLLITASEKNGGRTVGVKVKDKHILQAKKLE